VTGVGGRSAFYSSHFSGSLNYLAIWHVGFNNPSVLGTQNHGAARFALHLLWPLAHAVLFQGDVAPNLARTGKAKALLGA
jgi:hypothetical protein